MRTEPHGMKVRPITDITSTALGKEEMVVYACSPLWMNSHKEGSMWRVDPLLGNDHEIRNYTRAAAR
jgi:hypothetical protein